MSQGASEQIVHERECVHRREGVVGEFYDGERYIERLQRLTSSSAMKIARQVGPFFWSDAPLIKVWLCRDCAIAVGLKQG